jgi:hypothetical protein
MTDEGYKPFVLLVVLGCSKHQRIEGKGGFVINASKSTHTCEGNMPIKSMISFCKKIHHFQNSDIEVHAGIQKQFEIRCVEFFFKDSKGIQNVPQKI